MQSVWSKSVEGWGKTRRAPLSGRVKTDVLVVGGGITGILTAHRLRRAGVGCIVAEANAVCSGVTPNTTAKITAQHGLLYADLLEKRGRDAAQRYLDANTGAIEEYRALADTYPCDFEEKTAFVFSADRPDKLEREARAYQALGLPGHIAKSAPLPIHIAGALGMEHQAQMNPLKLLLPLADELEVYENTFVRGIEGGVAVTAEGAIHADHIVLATHFPLVNIPGLYFLKLYQHRSYVLALEGAPPLGAMYVDQRADGYSFRTYQNLTLIGGGDHRTGKPGGGFAALEALARGAYPRAEARFRWATQDCMSLDGVPYIGRHRAGKHRLYTATGFNKWGMTSAMVASRLLCELITEGRSELEELYAPSRAMLAPQLAANMCAAVAGLLSLGGPRCPHMGCKLHKNEAEGSWDCACHGSRFDAAGRLVKNPAKRGIRP